MFKGNVRSEPIMGEWLASGAVVTHNDVKVLVAQSRLTLWDPMDYSMLSSSVHGILQARILEWVAIPFSRESSQPRDCTQVSHIAGRFFAVSATKEAPEHTIFIFKNIKK